jgi:hypothetical protein
MQNDLLSQLEFVLIVLLAEIALYGALALLIGRVCPLLIRATHYRGLSAFFGKRRSDNIQTIEDEGKMDDFGILKSEGIASLFSKGELKSFFKVYLYILFVLEILIFFISFLCQLEPIHINFPWRYYLLASFLTPIVLTFLLGIVVKAFNLFCFGLSTPVEEPAASPGAEGPEKSASTRLTSSLRFFNQMPFLFAMLLLIVGAVVFSQSDHILAFLGAVGEKALVYGLIIMGVITFLATVFAFVWLVVRFKLEKIRYQYEYKRDVMLQLGVLVTEDERILDRSGQAISLPNPTTKQLVQSGSKTQ